MAHGVGDGSCAPMNPCVVITYGDQSLLLWSIAETRQVQTGVNGRTKLPLGGFTLSLSRKESSAWVINLSLTSVLVAEAAVLALAARIAFTLGILYPKFLSDNQQLVAFFNGNDHTNPPHWEIKGFIQSFINHSSRNNANIFKVHRKLNTTAHVVAT